MTILVKIFFHFVSMLLGTTLGYFHQKFLRLDVREKTKNARNALERTMTRNSNLQKLLKDTASF